MPKDPEPARPYTIYVTWIEGSQESYEVRTHIELDTSLKLVLNDRRVREVIVPFANVRVIEIRHD